MANGKWQMVNTGLRCPHLPLDIEQLSKQHPDNPRAAGLLLRLAQAQMNQQGFIQPGRLLFVRQLTERILTQYPESPAAKAAAHMQEQVDRRLGGRGRRRGQPQRGGPGPDRDAR